MGESQPVGSGVELRHPYRTHRKFIFGLADGIAAAFAE